TWYFLTENIHVNQEQHLVRVSGWQNHCIQLQGCCEHKSCQSISLPDKTDLLSGSLLSTAATRCIATIATGRLKPNKGYNETEPLTVGSCDHGPLVYTVAPGLAPNKMSVNLTFYSSVIEDAEPPTCQIPWNGTYVSPRPNTDPMHDSPLPGCFTMDSREGWYLTAYWFYLLDWGGAGDGH
ncbi:uncharacterized protein LOC118427018, partial [Branchiostoma floridae]|uniref:Uncharacterized protein LOC118427018 n=1 Tax=Branchiostoma floridae TaxID=7739 RepID=A0A9J7M0H8_BRAFL